MKAIIYCRKSTDRSDRQQLSIESQEEEARKLALREGLEVVKIFYESKSAKAPGRPLFNEMMGMFNSGKLIVSLLGNSIDLQEIQLMNEQLNGVFKMVG